MNELDGQGISKCNSNVESDDIIREVTKYDRNYICWCINFWSLTLRVGNSFKRLKRINSSNGWRGEAAR